MDNNKLDKKLFNKVQIGPGLAATLAILSLSLNKLK